MLSTDYIKWCLEHGLVVTKCYQFLCYKKAQPRIFPSCFSVSILSTFSEMSSNDKATPTRKAITVPMTRQGIIGLGKHLKIIQLEVNCSPNGTLSL